MLSFNFQHTKDLLQTKGSSKEQNHRVEWISKKKLMNSKLFSFFLLNCIPLYLSLFLSILSTQLYHYLFLFCYPFLFKSKLNDSDRSSFFILVCLMFLLRHAGLCSLLYRFYLTFCLVELYKKRNS